MIEKQIGCEHNLERKFVFPKKISTENYIALICPYQCELIQVNLVSKEQKETRAVKSYKLIKG